MRVKIYPMLNYLYHITINKPIYSQNTKILLLEEYIAIKS